MATDIAKKKAKEQDDLKSVVCPMCRRETEPDEPQQRAHFPWALPYGRTFLAACYEVFQYQDVFDQWLGDIRNSGSC